MINVNKLKGKIVENGLNIEDVAKQVEMDKSTLYRKLGRGGDTISIGEAQRISEALRLTSDERREIFLP